jgi:hypothetical protein
MEERRSSPRFDIVLSVKLDLGKGGILEGTWCNLNASGKGIMVRANEEAQKGDAVTLEMPVPVQMQTVQCKGQVVKCQKSDDAYEISIRIDEIDEQRRDDLRTFCSFLTPCSELDTADYLIQQGEKALAEASEVIVGKSMGERLEALMHELLSLRYHDALRNFEDALTIDNENEAAVEGFCYSLAKAISHYERAGLDGLADIIKVKALQYCDDKTWKIAEKSTRMDNYLLSIIRDVIPK